MSSQGTVARRLAAADPAGLMYGAIVSSAALAAVSLHTPEAVRVAVATGSVLVIYWISDLYVHAIAVRFDGDTRGMARRLARAASHKSSVLKGGLPGIAVYVLVYALGATSSTSVFWALTTSVVLLTVAGYLGARHAGAPRRVAALEGAGAGMLGVVVMIAKFSLH